MDVQESVWEPNTWSQSLSFDDENIEIIKEIKNEEDLVYLRVKSPVWVDRYSYRFLKFHQAEVIRDEYISLSEIPHPCEEKSIHKASEAVVLFLVKKKIFVEVLVINHTWKQKKRFSIFTVSC